jgi:DNA polymerase III epsilon subunit family exonuclease
MNWDELFWDQIPFVAIDTETTGLGRDDRICQVAVASFFGDGRLKTQSWLVYPGKSIPAEATRIHGITDDMVAKAPSFQDVMDEVLEELTRAPWVAHNLQFDAKMLLREIPTERWPRGIPTLCSMTYAKKHHVEMKYHRGHKLADLANFFRLDYSVKDLHDAKTDAQLLAQVTRHLMRGKEVGKSFTKMSEDWVK